MGRKKIPPLPSWIWTEVSWKSCFSCAWKNLCFLSPQEIPGISTEDVGVLFKLLDAVPQFLVGRCVFGWVFSWVGDDQLGGGFKDFSFLPRFVGRWSNLTRKFFKWVAQPPTSQHFLLLVLYPDILRCVSWENCPQNSTPPEIAFPEQKHQNFW